MANFYKIPNTYAAFIDAFPIIEYLPSEAIDLKAGRQTDGGWVISPLLTQYINTNLDAVLAYVSPELGAKIQYIVDNFTPGSFELITEEQARANVA